jgi:hypothetical protein
MPEMGPQPSGPTSGDKKSVLRVTGELSPPPHPSTWLLVLLLFMITSITGIMRRWMWWGGGEATASLARREVGGGAAAEGAGEVEAIREARGDEGVEGLDLRAASVGQPLDI